MTHIDRPGSFETAVALLAAVGRDLGTSGWVTVDAERTRQFADATRDVGWPGGVPGTLVLALGGAALSEVFAVPGAAMGVNYGVDDVRFAAPVTEGARLRCRARIEDARPVRDAVQVAVGIAIECVGEPEPVCTATMLARFHFPAAEGDRP